MAVVRALPHHRTRSLIAAACVLLFSAACLAVPIDYQTVGDAGYLGVFAITLVTTGALVLPIPYLAVIAKAATFLDPATVAVVAGLAAAIGELSGYVLGRSSQTLISEHRWADRLRGWMEQHGFLTIAVASFIPNPVFDAVGIAAGALGYSAWRFCAACLLGKTAKFLLITLATAYAVGFL